MDSFFLVGNGELDPRPSSASLVHEAVAAALAAAAVAQPPASTDPATEESAGGEEESGIASPDAPVRLLDLGCGCGALVMSALLLLGPRAVGVGLDLEASALAWARRNAEDLKLSDRLQLVCADFGQLHKPQVRDQLPASGFHAILCNPPYLRDRAKPGRATGEQDRALYAGADGLRAYGNIARSVALARPPLLSPRGVMVMQLPGACGERRRARIASLFTEQGFIARMAEPCERGIVRCLLISQGERKGKGRVAGARRSMRRAERAMKVVTG
jgi:methylase of polypeptide subunit release factors